MSLTNKFGLVAGTTALAIAGTAFGGVESDNDALAQIAELKQELAELKQQNGQDWLTEQRSSEIRGIVQDVLADADTRTSLQSSGAMAGYNNGFFLASPDGNFSLKVGGHRSRSWPPMMLRMQVRASHDLMGQHPVHRQRRIFGSDMGATRQVEAQHKDSMQEA